MKKNGFLTFIFACIPGAGQMYYGYMQRGLSIAMMLILCVMAATVVQPLAPAGWSPLYGRLRDRFGVSWVLDLEVPYSG